MAGYIPDPDDQFDTWLALTTSEIWMKLGGTPPTDLSESQFLATDSRTPYASTFDGREANQRAHFIGRWMSTRNGAGPAERNRQRHGARVGEKCQS